MLRAFFLNEPIQVRLLAYVMSYVVVSAQQSVITGFLMNNIVWCQ